MKSDNYQDENGEGSQSGSASGQIEFHDFLSSGERLRDDQIPPDEKRRILAVHATLNEGIIKKQKDLLALRKQLKEGKISLQNYHEGVSKTQGKFLMNPMFANKAQFHVDKQVNPLPSEYEANTNEGERNQLEQQYELQHRPQHTPKFNPKPRFDR